MVGTEGAARTAGYERIVVPLDGSQLAEEAIAHAESLARAIGASLHLVRVVDTPPLTRVGPIGLGVEQARDLLVMTTHGRTGLARWFFGSVAEAVLRRSQVPVLLVRSVAMP